MAPQVSEGLEDPGFRELCGLFFWRRALLALLFPWHLVRALAPPMAILFPVQQNVPLLRALWPLSGWYSWSQVDGSRLLTKHRPNAAWPRAGTLVLPSVGPEVASKPHAGMGGSDGMAPSVMSNTMADSDTLRSCSRFWMVWGTSPEPQA